MAYVSCCGNHILHMILILGMSCLSMAPVALSALDHEHNTNPTSLELFMSSRDEIVQMAGYGEEKLSTVLITGTLLCKSRFPHHHLPSLPISGAVVTATCNTSVKRTEPARTKTVTDKIGEFVIDLPSHLHAIPNLHKACSVRAVHLPTNSPCHPSIVARKHKAIRLSSVGNGIRTYTSGRMVLLHTTSKRSKTCEECASGARQVMVDAMLRKEGIWLLHKASNARSHGASVKAMRSEGPISPPSLFGK